MNEYVFQVGEVSHRHDRYGNHIVHAHPVGMDRGLILSGASFRIDPEDRQFFPGIKPGDTVHCQGGGQFFQSIVAKDPVRFQDTQCRCGAAYRVTTTEIRCPNPACSVTEYARMSYFVASYFQNKLNVHAMPSVYRDLVFSGVRDLYSLFSSADGHGSGIGANLIRSIRLLIAETRDQRDIYSPDQNSLILSFLDALGIPELTLQDICLLLSNETIDYQNGDGGNCIEYYYSALTQADYLQHITGISLPVARRITDHVCNRRLIPLFNCLSRHPI